MTCKEFTTYTSTELQSGQLGSEAAMHLELCAACRRAWYAEQELSRRLQEMKENVPVAPSAMDDAVIAAYRAKIQAGALRRSYSSTRMLAWAGLAAAIVLGTLIFAWVRAGQPITSVSWHPPAIAAPTVARQVRPTPVKATVAAKSHRSVIARGKPSAGTPQTLAAAEPRDRYESLMYCDALSCSGPMDVIRIEIPTPSVAGLPSWQSHNGFVQADVVVGSDGVARAIRIVR